MPAPTHPSPTIWIVSELYWPETTSTGRVMTTLAEGLARTHRVRVVCGQPTYSARGTRAPRREERGGVSIHRCAGTVFDKNVLPLRAINAATLGASVFGAALARVRRGDVVLVVTTPPSLPPLAALAARAKGASVVLLVHDVYPDVLVASEAARPGSLPVRALDAAMARVYRSASRVVAIGRDMAELVTARAPRAASRVVVIPNFADVENIRPTPRAENALLREHGLLDRFVVQVAGNLGRTHAADTVCQAALRLRDDPGVHFLVIGDGARRPLLEETVRRERLDNVTVLGRLPDASHATFLNACDLSLIPLVPGMLGVSVPSRTYATLAAGRPILASMDARAEVARLVEEERVGWVTRAGDADGVVRAIHEARADPARLAEMGRRARALAEARFTVPAVVEQFSRLVDDVIARG